MKRSIPTTSEIWRPTTFLADQPNASRNTSLANTMRKSLSRNSRWFGTPCASMRKRSSLRSTFSVSRLMPVSSLWVRSLASASSNARSASSRVVGRIGLAAVMSYLSSCFRADASARDSAASRILSAALDHQRADLLGFDQRAEVVPLAVLAVVSRQERHLSFRLDAVGHGVERQPMCDRQDRAAHDLPVFVRFEVRDERTVDLQHVERKLPKVLEARIPGAELVDSEPHAELLQGAQAVARAVRVLNQSALGELELDEAGIDGMRLQHGSQRIREIGLVEVHRGHVDRDAGHGHAGGFPALQLAANLFHDPETDRNDVPALLGHGHELAGADAPALRVVPMQHRFDDVDAMIGEPDLGLIKKLELPSRDGVFEICLESMVGEDLLVHARREELERVASALLRLIHRDVGVVQQGHRLLAVRGAY